MSIPAIVLLACLSAALTAAVLHFARRYLLDHPNERSSHTIPTPRGGGLAIVAGLAGGMLWSGELSLRWALIPLLLTALLSFRDDIKSIPSGVRLTAHVLIGVAAILLLDPYPAIGIPGITVVAGSGLMLVLTLFWLIGLTNAYNFMDGIDGIAGVQAIVAGSAWWWIGQANGLISVSVVGIVVMASVLGFLPFNFPRARIFMGDVGSATLGMTFALLPVLAMRESPQATWAPAVGVVLLWPFLFDTLFTLCRRAAAGQPLLQAHRSHLYQRMVIAGWPHHRVTLLYGALASFNAFGAMALTNGQPIWCWLSACFTSGTLLLSTRYVELRSRSLTIFQSHPVSGSVSSGQ